MNRVTSKLMVIGLRKILPVAIAYFQDLGRSIRCLKSYSFGKDSPVFNQFKNKIEPALKSVVEELGFKIHRAS